MPSTKKLGRPVKEGSARQIKLAKMKEKAIGGYIPLGRPVKEGSKRQIELAAKEAKKASGEVAQKGRPKMTEDQKAEAKVKREAAKAAALALASGTSAE